MKRYFLIIWLLGIVLGWFLAYKFLPPRDAVISIPCTSAHLEQDGQALTPPGFGKGQWIYCEDEFFKYRIPQESKTI